MKQISRKEILNNNIPDHIAIIMDGNGRWAKEKNLPRLAGHNEGINSVREIVRICGEIEVKYLTLFAFSTENWNRPKIEVDTLMKLLVTALKKELKNLKKNKVFYVTSGTQGEGNANLSFLAYQGNFKGISIDKDDMVLLSSKMIPGNERNIYNLINKLLEIGAHLVHEKSDFVHVSGHAGRDELKEMYAAVKPDICVPVHGEYAHLYEHAKLAKSFGIKQQVLITNGQKLHLAPEEPFVEDMKEYVGRNYVDGLNILDEDRFILRERRHMNFNGLAVASVVIEGKSGKVLSDQLSAVKA